MSLMLLDPNSQQPSTTRSVFWYGCLICFLKFTLSGINLKFFQVPSFSGSDFAVAISALGGIYALDKHITGSRKDNE